MPADPLECDACQVALKEWAAVCAALRDGRRTVLPRKGGIAEDRGEFQPEHHAFWLYPIHLHEAQQGVRNAFQVPGDNTPPGFSST